ncbi:N-acetylmuramoyl-L-alanine amidase [Limnobacter litoralis]|uniref:N-acetylmuramoyl-L-alanine amidase n=1 Tax=Limnobacter litoralis TaxID=481366 RepID=A0ABQ5YWS6_9BURK|nr:N-acetylmuramoyl-L-alanine amidase [Limnobacter litoralis]GLR27199.1 N-acetylmuramoyl-L-alanine amidase [Limnobacter litoralis]
MNTRRTVLKTLGASLLLQLVPVGARAAESARFVDVRLWPAEDYTRVTLEHDGALKYKYFLVENPMRMVVDISDMQLDKTLKNLTDRLKPDDPYVQQIRVGQFNADTVRIVFDLKAQVRPEVFTIDPVAEYKNRLVVDFYPKTPPDPLIALLKDQQQDAATPSYKDDEINRALNLAKADQTDKAPASESAKESPRKAKADADSTPQVRRLVTVAIDPGHGGEDPGAIGRAGTREKDVVLEIARMLKQEIDRTPGMRAMLTRNDDYFVPLGKRVQKARGVKADLFVSVHADGFIKPSARGSSVFVLSERGASSSAARWLADKQNASDLIGGVNIADKDNQLAKVLLDLSTTAQINDSMKLGGAVLGKLASVNQLHKAYVEQAGFAVLKAPDIPSILVETAFISNPAEEKKLNDPHQQLKIAKAIAGGVKEYFDKNPPVARSRIA